MSDQGRTKRDWIILVAVVVFGVAVDQVTKQLADTHLRYAGIVTLVEGFFELRYSRNAGAFFSIGSEMSPALRRGFFVVMTFLSIGLITHLYRRARAEQRALQWALIFLLAGAFGNLIDRVLHGEVIDFLHFHVRDVFHWATFNVADIFIFFGLVFLIVDLVKTKAPEGNTPREDATKAQRAEGSR